MHVLVSGIATTNQTKSAQSHVVVSGLIQQISTVTTEAEWKVA